MKVATNKIKDIVKLYHTELKEVYTPGEIDAILNAAFNHYLGYNRIDLDLRGEENLNQSDLLKLYKCCEALKTGKPVQYILNEAWFYNLKFYVNEHVLIPRPETEELVEMIIKDLRNPAPSPLGRAGGEVALLDIGTGSGCIAVSIKENIRGCTVSACDISKDALFVAKKNAEDKKLRVNFFEADVLSSEAFLKKAEDKFDVIVSNPPYIKRSEKNSLNKNVTDHEPHLALFVGEEDEIIFYKKIIDLCKELLKPQGLLYFELNPLTANDVKNYALKSNLFSSAELIKDMSGNVRFLRAIKYPPL